jgi:hypothetical protein
MPGAHESILGDVAVPVTTSDRSDKQQSGIEQLLAGLREIRSPLASGYVWLLFGWLIVAAKLPPSKNASGSLKSIYSLGAALGRVGIAIAASVLAYLLGVFTEQLANIPFRAAALVFRPRWFKDGHERERYRRLRGLVLGTWVFPGKALTRLAETASQKISRSLHRIGVASLGARPSSELPPGEILTDSLIDVLGEDLFTRVGVRNYIPPHYHALDSNPNPDPRLRQQQLTEWLFRQVVDDLPDLPPRLLGDFPEIHSLVDRPRAEAAFMLSISIPLLATILLLSFQASNIWFLALTLPIWTYATGIRLRRDTGALLISLIQTNDFSFSWSRPVSMLDDVVRDTIEELEKSKRQSHL